MSAENILHGSSKKPAGAPVRRAVAFDPHPLWLEAVAGALESAGVAVVATTAGEAEAIELLEEIAPEIVVGYLGEPAGEATVGLGVLQAAVRAGAKAVVLGARDDPAAREAAFAGGAVAFVLKTATPADLRAAIRQSYERSVYLAPAAPAASSRHVGAPAGDPARVLTAREREVLALVAEGRSNVEVGRVLWVTEQTVKFHLSNVYRKLGVSNRTEAARWATYSGVAPSVAPPEASRVAAPARIADPVR